jgi:hypothetical protein
VLIFRKKRIPKNVYRTHFLSNVCNDSDKKYLQKYSNTLNRLKWHYKSSCYKYQFEINKNNLKNTWKLIGTLIKRKVKSLKLFLMVELILIRPIFPINSTSTLLMLVQIWHLISIKFQITFSLLI